MTRTIYSPVSNQRKEDFFECLAAMLEADVILRRDFVELLLNRKLEKPHIQL